MRWGVRTKSSSNSKSRSRSSDDSKRAEAARAVLKKGGSRSLTNKELQHLVSRMELEKKLRDANPRRFAGGRKFARELLVEIGRSEARRAILTASAAGVAAALAAKQKK